MDAWNTKIEGNDEYFNAKGTFLDELEKTKKCRTCSK